MAWPDQDHPIDREPYPRDRAIIGVMIEPTDAALIAASMSVPESFADVFDRHAGGVHRYLNRRVGRDAADELLSEVFALAFEQRRRFDTGVASAAPWLYGIARHLVARWYRSATRRDRAYERLLQRSDRDPEDGFDAIATGIDAQRTARRLGQAIDTLADVDREALLLLAWERLTYDEIAQAQGVPIGTVRSRIFRARRIVRELLEPSGQLMGDTTNGDGR